MKFNNSTTMAYDLPVGKVVKLTNLNATCIEVEDKRTHNITSCFFVINGEAGSKPYRFTVNIPIQVREPLFPMAPILAQLGIKGSFNDTDDVVKAINASQGTLEVLAVQETKYNADDDTEETYTNVIVDPQKIRAYLSAVAAAPRCASKKANK